MVICNLDSAYKPWTKISVSSFLSPMSFVFSLDFVLDNSTKMSSQFQTHICPLCLLREKKWFYQLDLTLSGSDCKVPQMVQCVVQEVKSPAITSLPSTGTGASVCCST